MLGYLIGLFFGFLLCASITMRKKEKKKNGTAISASEMRRKQQEYTDEAEWNRILSRVKDLIPTSTTYIETEIWCKKNRLALKELGYKVEKLETMALGDGDMFRVYKISWEDEK